MYLIMEKSESRGPSRIDRAEDDRYADYLVGRYQVAYGSKVTIYKVKQPCPK
jgi:hypothetical protein